MPAVNAFMKSLSTCALLLGLVFVFHGTPGDCHDESCSELNECAVCVVCLGTDVPNSQLFVSKPETIRPISFASYFFSPQSFVEKPFQPPRV
jgi:hypothetical protein